MLATHPPYEQNLRAPLLPPAGEHMLGTDELGRDIWSRLVYGARITLMIVVLVSVIAAPVGLFLGTVSGVMGGFVDIALMRVTDLFLAFPSLILALAFVAALGPGLENAIVAIALTAWPPIARLARAETLTVRGSDYIAAVRLQGASTWRLILRHVVPDVHPFGRGARHAQHGSGHPHRRRARFPRPGRPAADRGMGRDGIDRPALHARQLVGRDHARASRSWS